MSTHDITTHDFNITPCDDLQGCGLPPAASEVITSNATKEKPGFWTRRTTFVQVRRGSNIHLLSFSLVTN